MHSSSSVVAKVEKSPPMLNPSGPLVHGPSLCNLNSQQMVAQPSRITGRFVYFCPNVCKAHMYLFLVMVRCFYIPLQCVVGYLVNDHYPPSELGKAARTAVDGSICLYQQAECGKLIV